jgi:hypothetical protein
VRPSSIEDEPCASPRRRSGPVGRGSRSAALAKRRRDAPPESPDGFLPSVPEVWEYYRDEAQKLGRPDPGPSPVGPNRVVALAEDPERGWEQMAPFFLHETNSYAAWQAQADIIPTYRTIADADELRATGQYQVVTPAQLVEELRAAPVPFAMLHPLCGGMPPGLAWSSLRLFETQVLPALP